MAARITLFLPETVAREAEAKATLLAMSLKWFTPHPKPRAGEFSYTRNTAIPYLPLLVLIGSIPRQPSLKYCSPIGPFGFVQSS